MKYLTPLFVLILLFAMQTPAVARNVQAELHTLQKQKKIIRQAQLELKQALGNVGKNLKKLDIELLTARKAYRQVRIEIVATDKRLKELSVQKESMQQSMQNLFNQMLREAQAAYRHGRQQSVWVDMLSNVSISELPHRQHLLKYALISQEQSRQAWQQKVIELTVIEDEEKQKKTELLTLKEERKDAERILVNKIAKKKKAAKALRADLNKKKKQERRLARQEKALQRLLQGLGDTLLASDKKGKSLSVRKQKGRMPWPINGSIMVGFHQKTSTGVKLSGVHLAPKKRSEAGRQVKASASGQVRYADWFGGYGLMMIVDYGHGIMAVYAHNDALHKQVGDWIEKNEILAEAGSTGWVDDTRLYFEIRDKGKPVNPARWCKK